MAEKDVIDSVEIRKAEVEDAEKLSELYNEVWEGKYPLNDFTEIKEVKKKIQEGHFWYLAYLDNKCIGSAVGTYDKVNNTVEFGRAVMVKEYRSQGISKKLYKFIRNEILESKVDILWGSLRNKAIYEISNDCLMTPTGYFEYYFVNQREVQLISMRLTEKGKKKRILSKVNNLYKLSAIKKIIKEMNLEEGVEGNYPNDVVVPFGIEEEEIFIKGNYQKPNKSLSIKSIFDKNKLPEYLQVILLIDKLKYFDFFKNLGFKITAFLPAWLQKNDLRYDCILLTNSFNPALIQDKYLKNMFEEFKKGFE